MDQLRDAPLTQHLIHIGFPKAGSSFLQRWFSFHPQFRYREGGVGGFWNVYDIVRFSTSPARPVRYYVTSTEGLTAPRDSAGFPYLFTHDPELADTFPAARAKACEVLKDLFPNATILIVTRGFRAMIVSHYSQYVREGGSESFEDWQKRKHDYDFNTVISLYRSAFPGKVIVLPYETFAKDQARFIEDLENRLGLDHVPFARNRVNPSLSRSELRWYPRFSRLFQKLPVTRRVYRRAFVPLSFNNKLSPIIKILNRIFGPMISDMPKISDTRLDQFRGQAEILAHEPEYAGYEEAYMFTAPSARPPESA